MKTDTTITEKIDGSFFPGKSYNDKGEKVYSSTASNPIISALTLFNPKDLSKNYNYTINDRGNIEYVVGENIFEFTEQADSNSLTPAVRYLARYLFNKYAETRTRKQYFLIDEYFTLRRISNTKDNRNTINKQLITLSKCMFWIRTPGKGNMASAQFIVEPSLKNGYVSFAYGDNYIEYVLENASYTPYFPNILFSLDSRYDYNAFSIGEKLSIYKGQNTGRDNENRISVEKLLKVTDLPTEERVKDINSRNTKQRISIPFINSLETLNNIGGLNSTFIIKIETPDKKILFYNGKSWNCGLKNISSREYNTDKLYDYQQLKDSIIIFDIVGYPELKPIEERLSKSRAIEQKQTKKNK